MIKQHIKRAICFAMIAVCMMNIAFSAIIASRDGYSMAADGTSYSMLGSNYALGSPMLNPQANAEDWNKYETVVWGIFLGNFCVPFVDDYESAFNLDSSKGTHGRGLQALSFGTGSDPQNVEVIKDLVTYAINNQSNSPRDLYVSYNRMDWVFGGIASFGYWISTNFFGTLEDNKFKLSEEVINSLPNLTVPNNPTPRRAVLKDLLVRAYEGTEGPEDETWAAYNSSGYMNVALANWQYTTSEDATNSQEFIYPDICMFQNMNMPTFAIEAQNAANGYEVVLDYTNSYDMAISSGALSYALGEKFREQANELLNDETALNSPLCMDSFGNICVYYDGRYIVVIPASANQYITKEPSINLVNSLMFNCSVSDDPSNLILNGGADVERNDWFSNRLSDHDHTISFGVAFNNNNSKTRSGGMVMFYDTDTIVMKKAVEKDTIARVPDGQNIEDARVNDKLFVSGYAAMQNGEKVAEQVPNFLFRTANKATNTGEIITELFKSEISDTANQYSLRIEPMNAGEHLVEGVGDDVTIMDVKESIETTLLASSSIANQMGGISGLPMLNYLIDYTSATGSKISLFDNAVIVTPLMPPGENANGDFNEYAIYRSMANFLYQSYKNPYKSNYYINDGSLVKAAVNDILSCRNPQDMMKKFVCETTTTGMSDFAIGFVARYKDSPKLYKIKSESNNDWANKLKGLKQKWGVHDWGPAELMIFNETSSINNAVTANISTSDIHWYYDTYSTEARAEMSFTRMLKVFYVSDVLQSVSNILGIREGTEFSAYACNIYLTYLKWYDVKKSGINGEETANFNPNIISEDIAIKNLTEISDSVKTREQKENEILNYTYLSLHPTEGRDYRNKIQMSNLSSWMYEQYQRMVYGGSDTYYYSTVATRNNTGFLNVDNYSENFMTASFMKIYPTIAIVIIGIGLLITLVIGILKRRKLSWIVMGMLLVVTVVLVLPSTGEFVPYLSNRVVQDIFEDKMTFWSISEQCTNANKAAQSSQDNYTSPYTAKLSDAERQQVYRLVNTLKVLYLDRYLTMKQDISNKVTTSGGDYLTEVQSMRSTRWMLPMIMRQWSASNSDELEDYVYVAVGDKLEDCANMYWFYEPDAAAYSGTVTSLQTGTREPQKYDGDLITDGVGNSSAGAKHNGFWEFRQRDWEMQYWKSYRSRGNEIKGTQSIHNICYIVDYNNFSLLNSIMYSDIQKCEGFEEWAQEYSDLIYANNSIYASYKNNFKELESYIENVGPIYDRYDRSSMKQVYGYLWMTESPLLYFYSVVNDSFRTDGNLALFVYDLTGGFEEGSDGEQHRYSFMHDSDTHGVRDVLDMESMFYNVVPYMYCMQLLTNGYENDGGIFGEETIGSKYEVYEGMNKGWLFRCNWATKIYENSDYNCPAEIGYFDVNGEKQKGTVNCQLFPYAYKYIEGANRGTETGRDMVFSEAQMISMGLEESDLSLVELKCIELNKEIVNRWTLLLNYVGCAGISREIMYRQMALDATMEFCKAFSPYGLTTASRSMYPTSLDLRSISFDSVMKMLMLNVTKNTSYVYGDSMDVLIDDSDVATQVIMLLCAFVCTAVIPLIRNITLGLLFYLGYVAVLKTLFKDAKEKMHTSVGYMGCHVLILVTNVVYLMSIKLLIGMTNSDQVLNLSENNISVGNPIWCLLVVLVISILYVVACVKLSLFTLKNFRDMGYSIMKSTISTVGSSISSGFEKIMAKMNEANTVSDVSQSDSAPTRAIPEPVNQGVGGAGAPSNGVNVEETSDRSSTTNASIRSSSRSTTNTNVTEDSQEMLSEEYTSANSTYRDSSDSTEEIDRTIDKGKQRMETETQRSHESYEEYEGSSSYGSSGRYENLGYYDSSTETKRSERRQRRESHEEEIELDKDVQDEEAEE